MEPSNQFSSSETEGIKVKWGRSAAVKIVLNIVIFIIVAVPVFGYYVYAVLPFRRGFFCDDESIRYPCRNSTVTSNVLYDVGYILPSLTIILNELCEAFKGKWQRRKNSVFSLKSSVMVFSWKIYKRIGVFLFGACLNEIVTNVSKSCIGRLRPCFLDSCRPNVDCSAYKDPHVYILNYTCTGDSYEIEDGRKSFPSGHSSFAFYTMVFLVMYLQFCLSIKFTRLLKPSLQTICLMLAWFTALSRISDYKHHWSDVTVGILLGSTIALSTVYFIADFGSSAPKTKNKCSINEENVELQRVMAPQLAQEK